MSAVDERIVKMSLDNQLFEKNARTSIETLGKLKEALKFTGVDKKIFDLESAVSSMDFSKVSSGVEALNRRFSAMGVAGMTVIQDLTRAAEGLAIKIKNVVFGQIKSGGWARATNIDQAKFQLKGLNVLWNDIEADISYGVDATAYGLDAAAKAASQLVASGVKYGKTFGATGNSPMAKALRGISGVAAMTNSSYEDISSIFTTVAGQGKLMTMQLRQLESRGLNAAAQMGTVMNKTEAEIRDLVTKGKIDFAQFSEAMDTAFGEHAKDANETFEGALANMKSALSRIGQEFATPLRENMVGVFNATRELINLLKKSNLTPLYEDFADFSEKASNFVTSVLNKDNFDFSFIDELVNKLHEAYLWYDTLMTAINPLWRSTAEVEKKTVEVAKTVTKTGYDVNEIAEKVRQGVYGNGEERRKALEAEGYSYELVMNKVNELEGVSKRYEVTEEDLAKAAGEHTEALEEQAKVESEGYKASKEAYQQYAKQQRELVKAKERERIVNEFIERLKPAAEGAASALNVITKLFGSIGRGAEGPLARIGNSIASIFIDIANAIGKAFTSFDEFMTASGGYEKVQNGVNTALSFVADIFERLAEIVHDLTNGKSLGDVISEIFGGDSSDQIDANGASMEGFAGKVKTLFTVLNDYIFGDNPLNFMVVVNNLTKVFPILTKLIRGFVSVLGSGLVFRAMETTANIVGFLGKTAKQIPRYLKSITRDNNATAFLKVAIGIGIVALALTKLAEVPFENLAVGVGAIAAIAVVLGILFAVINRYKGTFEAVDWIDNFILNANKYISSAANNNNATAIMKLGVAFGILAAAMYKLSELSWGQLLVGGAAIAIITGALVGLMVAFRKTSIVKTKNPLLVFLSNITTAFSNFLNRIGTGILLGALALTILSITNAVVSLANIDVLSGIKALALLGIMFFMLNKLVEELTFTASVSEGGLIGISVLMAVLALVTKSLANTLINLSKVNINDGVPALVMLGLLFGELFLMVAGLNEVANYSASSVTGVSALLVILALVTKVLVNSLTKLSDADINNVVPALVALGILFAELFLVVAGLNEVANYSEGSVGKISVLMVVIAIVTKMLTNSLLKLSEADINNVVPALVALGILFAELFLVVAGLNEVANYAQGSVGKVSILMIVIALVTKSLVNTLLKLSEADINNTVPALVALGLLFAELFLVVAGLNEVANYSEGSVGKISVLMIVLALVTKLLTTSLLKLSEADINDTVPALVALGLLFAELFLVVAGLNEVANNSQNSAGKIAGLMIVLALVTKVLSGVLVDLSAVPFEQGISGIALLGLLLLELTATMAIVGEMTTKKNNPLRAAMSIAIMLGALGLVVGLLAELDPKRLKNASKALSRVMLSMSAMMIGVGYMSKNRRGSTNIKTTMSEIAGIAALVGEIAILLGIFAVAIPDDAVKKLPDIADALSEMMIGLSLLAAGLALFNKFTSKDDLANDGLLLALGAAFTIVSAIAGYVLSDEQIQEVADNLERVEPALRAVGHNLGAVFNGLLSGFLGFELDEVVKDAVDTAKNLPEYLDDWVSRFEPLATSIGKVHDAFEDTEGISLSNATDKIGDISGDIAVVAESLGKIKKTTAKPEDIDNILSNWFDSIVTFASGLETPSFNGTTVAQNIDTLKAAMLSFSDIVTIINGGTVSTTTGGSKTVQGLSGDRLSSMQSAVGQMISFASQMVIFSWILSGVNDGAVSKAATVDSIVSTLGTGAAKIGQDSIIGQAADGSLIGEGSIAYFADQLGTFAKGLTTFSTEISGLNPFAVVLNKLACEMIMDLGREAADIGKGIDFVNGNDGILTDIGLFSTNLGDLGGAFKKYADNIKGMNPFVVILNKAACDMIMELSNAVPSTTGGFLEFLLGNEIGTFSDNLPRLGTGIKGFCDNIKGADSTDAEKAVGIITQLTNLFNMIDKEGNWLGPESVQSKLGSAETVIAGIFQDFAWELENYNEFDEGLEGVGQKFGEHLGDGIAKGIANTDASKSIKEALSGVFDDISLSSEGGDSSAALAPLVEALTAALVDMNTAIEQHGLTMSVTMRMAFSRMASVIMNCKSMLSNAASTAASGIGSAIQKYASTIAQIGVNLMIGLAAGIHKGAHHAISAAKAAADSVAAILGSTLQVKSPSRLTMRIGGYLMEGLGIGIDKSVHYATDSAKSAAKATGSIMAGGFDYATSVAEDTIISNLKSVYDHINAVITDASTISPTITPVVDLSQVQNGMNSANAMLSSVGSSFGSPLSYANSMFPGSYSYVSSQQSMTQMSTMAALNGIRSDLKELGEAMSGMQMVLDSGVLVGQLGNGMDRQLGTIQRFKERWA